MRRTLLCALLWLVSAWAQQPVINPGGVVNSASYAAGIASSPPYPQPGPALANGSLATIFGSNLAAAALSAQPPLPRHLGGTSVSVNGIAAPLLFVSPNQINFQIPTDGYTTPGALSIVVTTAAGQSAPYQLAFTDAAPGIFTLDASGCGRGTVLNVAADGSLSLNSPTNSAAPGSFIAIFGTGNGIVYNSPPDGTPAQSTPPLAVATSPTGPLFDFAAGGFTGGVYSTWVGRAPGLVGVDQFNYEVPPTVRPGCAVPLQLGGSPPVTISIASGGGPCSDPPEQGYGDILWQEAATIAPGSTATTTDTVTVSLQSSPGRQPPTPIDYMGAYTEGGTLPPGAILFGPACPVPGYRSLDAGTVTAEASGITAVSASPSTLPQATVPSGFGQVPSGQAAGLTEYKATLPPGTIKPGSFTISASGGADLGAFQSTVQIGSPIQVTTPLAGQVFHSNAPAPSAQVFHRDAPPPPYHPGEINIQWTGGDPDEWVVVKFPSRNGPEEHYPWAWVARASDGQITIQAQGPLIGFGYTGSEIVIEVVPDPSQTPSITAPNLSLGGRAQWKYTYRFEDVTFEN